MVGRCGLHNHFSTMHFDTIDHFPNLLHPILHHHSILHRNRSRRSGSRPVLRFVLGHQHYVVLGFDSLTRNLVVGSGCLVVDRSIGLVPLVHCSIQQPVDSIALSVGAVVVETRLIECDLQGVLSAPLGIAAVVVRAGPSN